MNSLNNAELDPLLGLAPEDVAVLAEGGVEIEGVVRVTNGQAIWVRGKVLGRIESNGPVLIDESGSVHGSVTAKSLQLGGAVHRVTQQDMVTLTGPLILSASAQLHCDAESGGLQMAYGAVVQGALRPARGGQAVPSASASASSTAVSTAASPAVAASPEVVTETPEPTLEAASSYHKSFWAQSASD